jgi:ribosomal protein S18 acetylase RimI-like enzyme
MRGYTSRAGTLEDADEIYRVIRDYDVSCVGYSDFAPDDLLEFFHEEHFDIARDSCLVTGPGSRAVGFAMLWGQEPHRRYSGFGVVHPEHVGRGIGSHLLSFLEGRMREHVVDDEGATLWNWVDRKDTAARRMVEAAGFAEVRRHYTMIGDLNDASTDGSLPPNVEIRVCTEKDAELVHSLSEETFAEHWGYTPTSYGQWRKLVYDRSDTDLSLWLLAFVDGEPAGFLIGRAMEDLGWVADLGVLKAHRKRGIATTLLRRSFSDFRERGLQKAGLGVDASNETGAVRVYEGVGMRAERVYLTYEKRYRP